MMIRLKNIFALYSFFLISVILMITTTVFCFMYYKHLKNSFISYGQSFIENIALQNYADFIHQNFFDLRQNLEKIYDPKRHLYIRAFDNEKILVFSIPDDGAVSKSASFPLIKNDEIQFVKEVRSKDQISSPVGFLEMSLNPKVLMEETKMVMYYVASAAVIVWLIFLVLARIFTTKILHPIYSLQGQIDCIADSATKGKEPYKTSVNLNTRITEVKNIEGHFNSMMGQISQYQRKMDEVQRMEAITKTALQVAHDIRSPLSSMEAVLRYFGEAKSNDPQFSNYTNLLALSAKRLAGIADDLLKKHKGGVVGEERFSLHQCLDELIGEYQSQEKYKEIQFVKEYVQQSVELIGDATQLQRAFGNIVKNGIEAMSFKGTITIRTEQRDQFAIVAIQDTGPGISEEKLQKVLSGGYTEGKKDGHGIGTSVVKETVENHGGKLWGESTLGVGTTFYIELPCEIETKELEIHLRTYEPFDLAQGRPKHLRTIVVIDDDPSLREQWRLELGKNRVQTLLCESYEDFETQGINAQMTTTAIVDYHYNNSEMNGGEIIQRLKAQGFEHLYLCTAEYWKPSVQKLAEELEITLCPKPLPKIKVRGPVLSGVEGCVSAYVRKSEKENDLRTYEPTHLRTPGSKRLRTPRPKHLRTNNNGSYKVLVIDDDPLIGVTWRAFRERMNIGQFYFYPNLEALIEIQEKENLDLSLLDFVFLDKNIEQTKYNVKEAANYLKSNKVKKLILATGDDVDGNEFSGIDHVTKRKVPPTLEAFL